MRSIRRVALTFTGVVGLVGATALAVAPTAGAGAGPTQLFNSDDPGFHADAAEVPDGICFVTITAAGGRGGAFTTAPAVSEVTALATIGGGAGRTVTARFAVNPGDVLDAFVADVGQNPPTGTDAGHGGNGGTGGGGGGGGGTAGNQAGAGGGGASAVSNAGAPLVVGGGGGGASSQAGGPAGAPGIDAQNGNGANGGGGGQADGDGGVESDTDGGGGGGIGTGGGSGGSGDGGNGNAARTVGGGGGG